ncbi:MAG TPA: hypothetical protein VFX36_05330 [Nitrospira sp.]|nr:hypothetical protein [Nitrospira sp.]
MIGGGLCEAQAFIAVFSLLGGLVLYGPIGLFIGPVLVSLFVTALQIYRVEYHAADVPSGMFAAASPPVVVP